MGSLSLSRLLLFLPFPYPSHHLSPSVLLLRLYLPQELLESLILEDEKERRESAKVIDPYKGNLLSVSQVIVPPSLPSHVRVCCVSLTVSDW